MDAIRDILKLPERQPEELGQAQASTPTPQYDLAKIQATIRMGKSRRANQSLNIPERYWGKVPLPGGGQKALRALRDGKSIFLTGSCGSGKTHIAVSLLNEWFADGIKAGEQGPYQSKGRGLFLPAVELFLEIKQSWGDNEGARNESEKGILDKYSALPMLVLDDLGAEKISEWSRQVLYLLIDRRYRDCRQTVITSNLSHDALAAQLDDRIASRIAEMGVVLDLGTKDYRLNKFEKR